MMAAVLATAGMAVSGAWAQTVVDPRVQVSVVAQGLTEPRAMTYVIGAGGSSFLVAQRPDGKVLYYASEGTTPQVILDVAVNAAGDRGLLGIAADPAWSLPSHEFVYLSYTESSTGTDTTDPQAVLGHRVYRYTLDLSTPIRLKDPVLLLDLPATPGPNRTGGVLRFGPDDTLYLVAGDMNRDGKLQNNAAGADPDDTGVIIRIDKSGRSADGNPFAQAGVAMSRDFAYGVGSGLGLGFDPVTRRLWDTEAGPGLYDEVNLVPAGLNSGSTRLAGPASRDPQGTADLWTAPGSVYRDPDFSWAVPVAPTGLSFVASRKLGCGMQNDLLVGDAACGNLYHFHPNAARDGLVFTSTALLDHVADNPVLACFDEMSEILYGTGFGVVTDVISNRLGTVDLVSSSHGRIYRLSAKPGTFADADGDGVDDVCDCAPADRFSLEAPGETPYLRVDAYVGPGTAVPVYIAWDVLNGWTGASTRATIVSGDLGALRYTNDYRRACTLATNKIAPLLDPRLDPPQGYGYYYLVRSDNACGSGTYGDWNPGTAGGSIDPRDALDAAVSLPVCGACTGRAGGATITFAFPPSTETMRAWITNGPFIDQAKQFLAAGTTTMIPVFDTLLDGRDCDPLWTWHPDPSAVSWAEAAIEVCDGLPSGVESDKSYWFRIGFCPWSAQVSAVDDQR